MWMIKKFDELSKVETEEIFRLRQTVFIIVQKSLFIDIDGQDVNAIHIFYKKNNSIVSYCRLIIDNSITIGRVIVNPEYRGVGKGRELFEFALEHIKNNYPTSTVDITAMCYLEKFYESFGFEYNSERYDIADHMHVDMKLEP